MIYFLLRVIIVFVILLHTYRYAKMVRKDGHRFGSIGVYLLLISIVIVAIYTELDTFH